MNFSISEEAEKYMNTRFPRATREERGRMIKDWVNKLEIANGVVRDFERRVRNPSGLKILDAGSGSGGLSIAFSKAGAFVTGIDIEKELTDVAQKNSESFGTEVKFIAYSGYEMPFEGNTFDACISVSVLEHTSSPQKYLSELLRVLKKGGYLYLAFPNKLWPLETHTKLWFLTYLPQSLRPKIVSIFKRNPLEDNNLHFYGYFDLIKMINFANETAHSDKLVIVHERGQSQNFLKKFAKKLLAFWGIPYRAVLPHVMVVLKKE